MSDHEKDDGSKHSHGAHAAHQGSHEEHEGAPEWLISFADNVTLMMGFFVILLAMNLGPKGGSKGEYQKGPDDGESSEPPLTFLDAAISIREAFNNPVSLNSMDPDDKPLVQRLLERQGKSQVETDGPQGDEHDVQSLRPSKYYSICGVVPFDTGSATLSSKGNEALEDIAKHIRGLRLIVDVRGNVSAAESFGDPQGAMRLSFERALAVANGLAHRGVDWKQMRLLSCADLDRKAPVVYDHTGHPANERVEIVVSDQVMPSLEPAEENPDYRR